MDEVGVRLPVGPQLTELYFIVRKRAATYRSVDKGSGHMSGPKLPTYTMLVVIGAIHNSDGGELYGRAITEQTKIASGTLYPVLQRLVEAGVLKRRDEKGTAQEFQRPLRALYRLTPKGKRFSAAYNAWVIAKNPPLVSLEEFK